MIFEKAKEVVPKANFRLLIYRTQITSSKQAFYEEYLLIYPIFL